MGMTDTQSYNTNLLYNLIMIFSYLGHYAATEAVERCRQLLDEHEKLHFAYQAKKVHLDQLLDLHIFLREAKQLEDLITSQEATLGSVEFEDTVDEVDRQVKKHDAFEKLVHAQDERLEALVEFGDKLISQKHFESRQVASKLASIQAKRMRMKQLCAEKREQLNDALLYAKFNRDIVETMNWIAEKQKKLDADVKIGEVNSLEDKMKKLQKHQAFVAEVAANESRIKDIIKKGETLIAKRHRASKDIRTQLHKLQDAWNSLLRDVDLHGKGLEEAQDILDFNNQLEKIEAWIRDKELMIQAGDTGRDYEHCQELQRKLDDVDSDMRVDDTRVRNINLLADKLISKGHSDVQQRRNNFVEKWQNLQGALEEYREKLARASEIHLYIRDVDDTYQRITEKLAALEVEDVIKDLNGIEALLRKQEAVESEIFAIEAKIRDHNNTAHKLSQKHPQSADVIHKKLSDLQNHWQHLLLAKQKRKQALDAAYTKQKFLTDLQNMELWVTDTIKRMNSQNKPQNVGEAEALIQLHDELKAEIDGRNASFKQLKEFGGNLAQNSEDEIVKKGLEKLQNLQSTITEAWDTHKQNLTYEYEVQECKELANQLDNWFASKEAFLNNEDIGDNPRTVEALIKKHLDFENVLSQQLIKVHDFENVANTILNNTHYDNTEISKLLQGVLARKDNLLENSASRKKKLLESRALQEFLRDVYEFDLWLNQKIQVASDENYLDPTNLQSKIQKHAAFDAEINANADRTIQNIIGKGQELIDNDHFAKNDIEIRLSELQNDWKQLQALSELKRERLNEAYQALLFNRSVDEFETWLSSVEQQLTSSDYGKDLASVNSLMKKHSVIENDIEQHKENCDSIQDTIELFTKNGHFMLGELEDRAQAAIERFERLHKLIESRKDSLQSSFLLHQFLRDIDDEMQWLIEREPLAASHDLGTNLNTVQRLQKKHQALEAELTLHEPVVGALATRASQLARHPSSQIIEENAKNLKTKLSQLQDLASIRRLRLQDALESHTVIITLIVCGLNC